MKQNFINYRFLFLVILIIANIQFWGANSADELDNLKISASTITELEKYAQGAYSTFATICHTYKIAVTCLQENIPGDFVECGVGAGTQICAMGHACQLFKSNKKIHAFDSFEGIPFAGPNDVSQPGIGEIKHDVHVADLNTLLVSSGITVHALDNVQNNIYKWRVRYNNFLFHKGWFQHVLPVVHDQINQIAFLRLDGDLYESTLVCLEYLYPKIVKGGYIVIDDYALPGCKKAVDQYLAKHDLQPQIRAVIDGSGPVYWKI